jgi:hypothetical protein
MSLGGRLSDFSLPELLQVVALSRKTGTLEICGEHGAVAWLGLREGAIVRVALDDGSLEPGQVLEKRGVDASAPRAQVDAILWESALDALLRLFDWREGDFTFEACADPTGAWRGSAGIVLPTPVSPEYLALEGARLADESEPSLPSLRLPQPARAPGAGSVPRADVRAPPQAEPPRARACTRPVICVDRDLRLLERIKGALADGPEAVHIFQDSASALHRLKQYVLRGENPALVLGSDLEDPLDPRRGLGWKRFAERVRALSPHVRIAVIAEGPGNPPAHVAWLARPPAGRATEADMSDFLQTLRGALGGD